MASIQAVARLVRAVGAAAAMPDSDCRATSHSHWPVHAQLPAQNSMRARCVAAAGLPRMVSAPRAQPAPAVQQARRIGLAKDPWRACQSLPRSRPSSPYRRRRAGVPRAGVLGARLDAAVAQDRRIPADQILDSGG